MSHRKNPIPTPVRELAPAVMNSDTRSLIMMVVALVLARITSGITEASATGRPSMPWTWPCWLTTAMESLAGPILHVPAMWCWV